MFLTILKSAEMYQGHEIYLKHNNKLIFFFFGHPSHYKGLQSVMGTTLTIFVDRKSNQWMHEIWLNYYSPALLLIKGYLHYKTITSQNESFEAQVKNFFISQKSYVPFSRYSSFCIFNHPMIYQICDVMMSIST